MKLNPFSNMSRLKKKLMLYFLLIAIVSVSVSAEIILEVSSKRFQNQIQENFITSLKKNVNSKTLKQIKSDMKADNIFKPIYDLRNRMVLLLLVVSGCIIAAFFLFTKDIVSPMDGIGPDDLNIIYLIDKVKSGVVKELIFALSSTMEGDTTNFYIYKLINKFDVVTSTIARGVSVGDDLEYTDEITLGRSIINRIPFESSIKI